MESQVERWSCKYAEVEFSEQSKNLGSRLKIKVSKGRVKDSEARIAPSSKLHEKPFLSRNCSISTSILFYVLSFGSDHHTPFFACLLQW